MCSLPSLPAPEGAEQDAVVAVGAAGPGPEAEGGDEPAAAGEGAHHRGSEGTG